MTEESPKPLRVLGHPAHAPLTHFPLALWTIALLGDLAYAWSGNPFWWSFTFWNIAIGLAIGSLTLMTGFYDFAFIPEGKPLASQAAVRHMTIMSAAACLFGVSLYFHRGPAPLSHAQGVWAIAFTALGALLLQAGGWLGGQLVYHYGIGYDD
jgi:uncharacterized membrane protein